MRHYCTALARSVLTARANATQIYWVAASALAHLPSPCAAAKFPRKIYARCLTPGEKGTGHNKPESNRRSKAARINFRSEEHTSELQSRFDLVCRLLLEKKKIIRQR